MSGPGSGSIGHRGDLSDSDHRPQGCAQYHGWARRAICGRPAITAEFRRPSCHDSRQQRSRGASMRWPSAKSRNGASKARLPSIAPLAITSSRSANRDRQCGADRSAKRRPMNAVGRAKPSARPGPALGVAFLLSFSPLSPGVAARSAFARLLAGAGDRHDCGYARAARQRLRVEALAGPGGSHSGIGAR